MKQLTKEEFVRRAKKIHNNKYNYTKTEYINKRTKVKIICPVHGEFLQRPDNHIHRGSGCPKCKQVTTKDFIKKAKEIHGDKYDYSKVEYKKAHEKVYIICPEHGEFWQEPNCHIIKKQKCPLCSKSYKGNAEIFIDFSRKIHGDKYDYSKVNYINSQTKVKIICPVHGEFLQRPDMHINRKNGCPKCKISHGENKIRNFLLENNIKFEMQKCFNNCKNKNPLPFDFYLPNHNMLIEYDGRHHFSEIEFFGGINRLEYTKNNDKIKDEYCKKNNIMLMRIPYTNFDNIDKILEKKIDVRRQ